MIGLMIEEIEGELLNGESGDYLQEIHGDHQVSHRRDD